MGGHPSSGAAKRGLARWYLPPPPRPVLPPPPSSRHPRLHTPHCFLRPLATTCNLAPGTCNLQPATSHHVHWGREPELRLRDHVVAGMPSLFLHLTSAWGFGGGVDHAAASL